MAARTRIVQKLQRTAEKRGGALACSPNSVVQPELDPERALPVSLLRTREAVMAHMRPVLRSHGVTEQQWRVLRSVSLTVPIDKTRLASKATLLMPSLLRILRDLEGKRLLRLVPSKHNARLKEVVLTVAGARYVERVSADILVMSEIVKGRIGMATVEKLSDLLNEVEARLS